MDAEKIFWVLTVLAMGGFFAFLISGSFVAPVNAAQQDVQLGAQQAAPSDAGGASAPAAQGGTPAPDSSGVQEVSLYVQGSNYYPNPIRVKKGIPVKLVADMGRFPGCSRSIIIPDFGVRKVLGANDNVIEFTPDKSGTFDFGCSMWMYTGKLVVEEADGTVAAFTGDAPAAPVGSCGSGSGGCGCGG